VIVEHLLDLGMLVYVGRVNLELIPYEGADSSQDLKNRVDIIIRCRKMCDNQMSAPNRPCEEHVQCRDDLPNDGSVHILE